MTEAIIIAVIAAAGSVIGQAFITFGTRKKDEIQRAVLDERTGQRLKAIEHKLDIHNGYAEKLGVIQQDIAALRVRVEEIER